MGLRIDEKTALLARLRQDAARIAGHFGLVYRDLDAERGNVKRRYGSCHADGRIRLRLCHARTGRPLRYSSLVDTLCHELAHLRHFNHGPAFHEYYWRLLAFARREGIYQPRRRGPRVELPPDPAPARAASTAPPRRHPDPRSALLVAPIALVAPHPLAALHPGPSAPVPRPTAPLAPAPALAAPTPSQPWLPWTEAPLDPSSSTTTDVGGPKRWPPPGRRRPAPGPGNNATRPLQLSLPTLPLVAPPL